METNPSSFFIISCFLLFLVFYSIPQGLASRKLLDLFPNGGGNYLPGTPQVPPPTPVNKVTHRSETKNGTHAQVVCVNGQTRSQSGTVSGTNGHPVIEAKNHTGSQIGTVNGNNGKPIIEGYNTTGSQTAIINGNDGKPKFEVHKYDNGTSTVTVLGDDGKPLYQINALPPPESTGGGPAGGYSYTPPLMSEDTQDTCNP